MTEKQMIVFTTTAVIWWFILYRIRLAIEAKKRQERRDAEFLRAQELSSRVAETTYRIY